MAAHRPTVEVITDRGAALANVVADLNPAAFQNTGQLEIHRCQCDHGRLKARLRPMCRLMTVRTASVVIRGALFIQNLRRGQSALGVEAVPVCQPSTAFDELLPAI